MPTDVCCSLLDVMRVLLCLLLNGGGWFLLVVCCDVVACWLLLYGVARCTLRVVLCLMWCDVFVVFVCWRCCSLCVVVC